MIMDRSYVTKEALLVELERRRPHWRRSRPTRGGIVDTRWIEWRVDKNSSRYRAGT